jgi:hypothetical protein
MGFVLIGMVAWTIKKGYPGPGLSSFLYLFRENSALTVVMAVSAWFTMIAGIIEGNRARERGLTADQAAPKLSVAKAPTRLLTDSIDTVEAG